MTYARGMKLLAGVILLVAGTAFADSDPSPKEQVDKVMTDHMTEFRDCYTKRVKTKPTLAGKLTVLMTIEEKGNVSAASVTVSLDDEVDACVAKVAKTLTFPSPGQQVKVKYPFDFHK